MNAKIGVVDEPDKGMWFLFARQGSACFHGHAQKQGSPERLKTFVSRLLERKYAYAICLRSETLDVIGDQVYQALTDGPKDWWAPCR
jgi:hypothetical protein